MTEGPLLLFYYIVELFMGGHDEEHCRHETGHVWKPRFDEEVWEILFLI